MVNKYLFIYCYVYFFDGDYFCKENRDIVKYNNKFWSNYDSVKVRI